MVRSSKVNSVRFGLLSPEDFLKLSVCEVDSTTSKGDDLTGSVYDERMGILDRNKVCMTCGNNNMNCAGHFGHIKLFEPVYNPITFEILINVIKCVCNKCGKLLLNEIPNYIKKLKGIKRLRGIIERCNNIKLCMRNDCDGVVPKYTNDKFKIYYKYEDITSELLPKQTYSILSKISDEDFRLMGFNEDLTEDNNLFENINIQDVKPTSLMYVILPVIPPCDRPYIVQDGNIHDDDLTDLYKQIVRVNNILNGKIIKRRGKGREKTHSDYILELRTLVWALIDNKNDLSKVANGGRSHNTICNRMKDKDGIAQSVATKRFDFYGRCVIDSGGPLVRADELGLPRYFTTTLTIPEVVLEYNISHLQDILNKGKANFVLRKGSKINLQIATKNYTKPFDLKIGDILERHLIDGDPIIVNRNPTLREESMIGMFVKEMPYYYGPLRMPLAITKPLGADFDGDEVSVEVPQTIMARMEVMELLSMKKQIVTNQTSSPICCIVQDDLVASYVISNNYLIPSEEIMNMCMEIENGIEKYFEVFEKCKIYYKNYIDFSLNKFTEKVDGKILFSMLLPSNFWYNSGNVIIKEGILVSGNITKKDIGTSSNNIIHRLYLEYSEDIAVKFITELSFVMDRWFIPHNFSIGIDDCLLTSSTELKEMLMKIDIDTLKAQVSIKNAEMLENEISGIVNDIISIGTLITNKYAKNGKNNGFILASDSGAKGSVINITQTTFAIGQQNVSGKRIKMNLDGRTLVHQKHGDDNLLYRGFIRNGYFSGLTPIEAFLHSMAGREGIIDTAQKTAGTGYIGKKIARKIDSCKVYYDGSVRNSCGEIIQFLYGDDGFKAKRIYNIPNLKYKFFIDVSNINKMFICNNSNKRKLLKDEINTILSLIVFNENYSNEVLTKVKKIFDRELRKMLEKIEIDPEKIGEFAFHIKKLFEKSKIKNGENVGLIASHSINEIGVQLTLDSFHSTGSAKKMTLGMAWFETLLNVSKNPKNYMVSCEVFLNKSKLLNNLYLKNRENKETILKELKHYIPLIKETKISNLIEKIEIKYINNNNSLIEYEKYSIEEWLKNYSKIFNKKIEIKGNWMFQLIFNIEKLIEIDTSTTFISDIINESAEGNIYSYPSPDCLGIINVFVDPEEFQKIIMKKDLIGYINSENIDYYIIRDIVIPFVSSIKITGVDGVIDAYIRCDEEGAVIDTKGVNYLEILKLPFVDTYNTTCNDIRSIESILGIEAARNMLYIQLNNVITFNGNYINPRHINLLADAMTTKGELTAANRNGISRKEGPISKALFEEATKNFVLAGAFAERDELKSLLANIMTGSVPKGGTGSVKVIDIEKIPVV